MWKQRDTSPSHSSWDPASRTWGWFPKALGFGCPLDMLPGSSARWCLWAFAGLSPRMTTSDGAIFHGPFPSSPSALSNCLAATRAFRDGYLASGSVVLDAIGLAAGGKNVPGLQDHTALCSLTARPTGVGIAFQPVLGTALGLLWAWQCPGDVVRWVVVVAGVVGWDGMGLPWRSVPTSVML